LPAAWAAKLGDALNARESVAAAAALASVFAALYPKFGGAGLAAVALGFALHELSHRQAARVLGCGSRFYVDLFGLALTLLSALLPVAFLAPGYVGVSCWGFRSSRSEAIVAAAGPASNVALSAAFLAAYAIARSHFAAVAASVNAWLALFNLLPLGPFDGAKVARGSFSLWLALFAASAALLYASR